MKDYGTRYLFNIKNLGNKSPKSEFLTKNSFCQKQKLRQNFHKIFNISESTEFHLVLNEIL